MRRLGVGGLALVFGASVVAARANADCMPPNRFAATEHAARVVVLRVGAMSKSYTAPATVETVIKGDAEPTTLQLPINPMTGVMPQAGRRYLVYFDAKGQRIDSCSTAEVTARDPMVATLRRWVTDPTAESRATLLVDVGLTTPKSEALAQLGQSPRLLAAITAAQRARLIAAIPKSDGEQSYALAWVLGRLHATTSVDAWQRFVATSRPNVNERPIQDALELMTNHKTPDYVVGRDYYGEQARRIHEDWHAWLAAHGNEASDAIVAAGFASRGVKLPASRAWNEPAALRALMAETNDDLTRRVALNACELRRKSETTQLGALGGYIDWPAAIAACTD